MKLSMGKIVENIVCVPYSLLYDNRVVDKIVGRGPLKTIEGTNIAALKAELGTPPKGWELSFTEHDGDLSGRYVSPFIIPRTFLYGALPATAISWAIYEFVRSPRKDEKHKKEISGKDQIISGKDDEIAKRDNEIVTWKGKAESSEQALAEEKEKSALKDKEISDLKTQPPESPPLNNTPSVLRSLFSDLTKDSSPTVSDSRPIS